MEITTDLVKHLSNLSRLKFDEKETENFKEEFAKTMTQIDKIEKANLDGIEIENVSLDAKQELRADEVKQGLTVKEVVKNAPDSLGGSILIPVEII
ncbi:MAG: Asp-tRNA(Asn)/Glu-tRNA(Gln) amidotransferase subunit GatC [Clostridiales bacterium]|nr:Asp-tRNA(Asn)/Glu-tRNA(Gln) amidotransferase subunit GatC [Candidatus Apopatousia equi]